MTTNTEFWQRAIKTSLCLLLSLGLILNLWCLQSLAASAVVTGSVVNVRSGPGTGYTVAGVLYNGTQLEVTGHNGSWEKVRYGSLEGWVLSSLIKVSPPQTLVVGVGVANLRSGPGTGYDIVGEATKDEVLTLVSQEGDWYLAQTAAGLGVYIRKDMVAGPKASIALSQNDAPDTGILGPPVKMVLNGRSQSGPISPIVYNHRVLVPLREVFDEVGGTVGWNKAAQTATVNWGSKKIVLPVNSYEPTVNGSVWGTDVPTMIVQNNTMAPLRFIIEALGGTACWDSKTATVYVFIPPADGLKAVALVVNSPGVNLRNGPGTQYQVVDQAMRGEQMAVVEQQDGWYKVTRRGQTAWVAGWVVDVIWGYASNNIQ